MYVKQASKPPRFVRDSAMAAILALAAGCSLQGTGPHFNGHVPARTTLVGQVSLPEVHPGQPDRPFVFRARPGQLLYVFFGYASCPDICPTTLSDLRKAIRLLGRDSGKVELALVTVDSDRDSAAVLAPYVESYVPGGHALRPKTQGQLGAAETAFGATSTITRTPSGKNEVSHTAVSYLVDDTGRIVLMWDFGTPPADLASDMRTLLARPSVGASGASPAVEVAGAFANATPPGASAGASWQPRVEPEC